LIGLCEFQNNAQSPNLFISPSIAAMPAGLMRGQYAIHAPQIASATAGLPAKPVLEQ
jgi:hypothetical protein